MDRTHANAAMNAWSDAARRSVAEYGFAACPDALGPDLLHALRAEALERLNGATVSSHTETVSYRASMAGLGPLSLAFLERPVQRDLLRHVFGAPHELSTERSCFTRYGDGGHLGAHLDLPAADCAITTIVYLMAESPDPDAFGTGLVLKVYGEGRDSVGRERLRVPTRAGTVVVGRGSRYWHERPVLRAGESVVAITACYKPAP